VIRTRLRLIISACAIASVIIGVAGCFPKGVVWLPDSTEVIFTENEGARLVRYDLVKKARKVIVEDTKTKTSWPAISADGKKIAVARIETFREKGSATETERTQVIIYDLLGRELQRSRVHSFESKKNVAMKSGSSVSEAGLNWSGPLHKILLSSGRNGCLVYDCVSDSWTSFDVECWPPNNQPVRPDGKGFLVFTKSKLMFADWDGWVSDFSGDPFAFGDLNATAFEWLGNVARVVGTDGIFEFDTNTMRLRFIRQQPMLAEPDESLIWMHTFPNATQLRRIGKYEQTKDGPVELSWKLEVNIPSMKKRRTLFGGDGSSLIESLFFPSPDRKRVAFVKKTPSGEETIIVVDDNGAVVATIAP